MRKAVIVIALADGRFEGGGEHEKLPGLPAGVSEVTPPLVGAHAVQHRCATQRSLTHDAGTQPEPSGAQRESGFPYLLKKVNLLLLCIEYSQGLLMLQL